MGSETLRKPINSIMRILPDHIYIYIYMYMLDLTPIQDSTVTTRMTFHPFSGSGNPNLNIHDCDWHFVVAGVDPTYMTFSERFP